jgi:hypothetical protein
VFADSYVSLGRETFTGRFLKGDACAKVTI